MKCFLALSLCLMLCGCAQERQPVAGFALDQADGRTYLTVVTLRRQTPEDAAEPQCRTVSAIRVQTLLAASADASAGQLDPEQAEFLLIGENALANLPALCRSLCESAQTRLSLRICAVRGSAAAVLQCSDPAALLVFLQAGVARGDFPDLPLALLTDSLASGRGVLLPCLRIEDSGAFSPDLPLFCPACR